MTRGDYENLNAIAITVDCPHPLCDSPAGEPCETVTTGEGLLHYARYRLAMDEAVQKFAKPESKELLLTLHMLGGTRDRSYRLDIITDEESRFAKLTVEQFATLLAGDQIKVQAEL